MATKKIYTVVAKPKEFLDKTPKAKGCTLAKDKDGYFVYTHRWASKRYKTICHFISFFMFLVKFY